LSVPEAEGTKDAPVKNGGTVSNLVVRISNHGAVKGFKESLKHAATAAPHDY
jgi:hypothetical protein